jgi:hypothetical protein
MAIAFRSAANAGTSTAGTSLLITKPSGVSDGDVLVALVECGRESGRGPQSGPAGWTNPVGYNSETTVLHNLQAWVKVAGASEPTDYTWTNTGGGAWAGTITAWTGVDTASPVGATASGEDTTLDSTFDHSGLTTGHDGSVAIYGYGINEGPSPTRVPATAHASSTKRGEANSTVTGVGMAVMLASEDRPTAGATGARNATSFSANSTTTWVGLELKAASGGGGGMGAKKALLFG